MLDIIVKKKFNEVKFLQKAYMSSKFLWYNVHGRKLSCSFFVGLIFVDSDIPMKIQKKLDPLYRHMHTCIIMHISSTLLRVFSTAHVPD